MAVTNRVFSLDGDWARVYDFLDAQYSDTSERHVWLAPVWEYAYTHAVFDAASAARMGVWEEDGRIVAVALYELGPGRAFLFCDRHYGGLAEELVRYAESELSVADGADRVVSIFVPDSASALRQAVKARGFERATEGDRPMAVYTVQPAIPAAALPEGYRLSSLAEDNDLVKLDRVLWRGFGHDESLRPTASPENAVGAALSTGSEHRGRCSGR